MKLETRAVLLQAQCMMQRIDPVLVGAAALFGIGMLCALLWLPQQQLALTQKNATLQRLEQQNRIKTDVLPAPLSQNEIRMQQFYENLGDNGYAEQQLKTLFDIAAKQGLKLNTGEYKSSVERNSDTVAYQITLPVTGPYPAIREFCEEVLLAIPFASLNEISFKRDAIAKNNLEATLRFTLYLSERKKAGQP